LEKTYSIEEFMALQEDLKGKRYELVKGKLSEMAPAGDEHSTISGNLMWYLMQVVRPNKLGRVYPQDTAFVIDPINKTVRAPDLAFVASNRLPKMGKGAVLVVPDLAVEVVSPNDLLSSEVAEKVREYQQAGVRLVWVINPRPHRWDVQVYHPDSSEPITLNLEDELDGEEIIPGFRLKVNALFEYDL
jgi:Uma2 family endonuclease